MAAPMDTWSINRHKDGKDVAKVSCYHHSLRYKSVNTYDSASPDSRCSECMAVTTYRTRQNVSLLTVMVSECNRQNQNKCTFRPELFCRLHPQTLG